MHLLDWVHLPEVDGLVLIVEAPGFLAPHRYSLVEMTGQRKGLKNSDLPPSLFGTTSIKFVIELGECEPGSEHIVLRLSSNTELLASVNWRGDISERHNYYAVFCIPGQPTTELRGPTYGHLHRHHQTRQGSLHQAGPRLSLPHKQ